MKKIFAILLAMMLVLSMTVVAIAEPSGETPAAGGVLASEAQTFEFDKTYAVTGATGEGIFPNETLHFDVACDDGNPDSTKITIVDQTIDQNPDKVAITIPAYNKAGHWVYTVTEAAGNTAGVTYNMKPFVVEVTVTYGEGEAYNKLVSQVHITTRENGEKITGIVNKYDLGNLTVQKVVKGNLASQTQKFTFHVTFETTKEVKSPITIGGVTFQPGQWAPDGHGKNILKHTFTLSHKEINTMNNIPAGIGYNIEEDESHFAKDPNGSNTATGYEVMYENEMGEIHSNDTSATVVTNTKGAEVDTGISLDSLPYVMLIGLVVIAGAAMLINRRKSYND